MMNVMKDKNPKNKVERHKWWTPLHTAAQYGQLDICNAIMKQITDKNPMMFSGWTPLHAAASSGRQVSVCEAIMKNVTDKNPSDKKGITPLHVAASNDHFEICRAILEKV